MKSMQVLRWSFRNFTTNEVFQENWPLSIIADKEREDDSQSK